MSFQSIVEEIMSTHHSLLKRELPKITARFESLSAITPDNEALTEARHIFAKVRNKVEIHLKDEESILFPNGIALERGTATIATELDQLERLAEMEKEHDNCSHTLSKIQQTLLDELPASELRTALLDNIQLIQDDFVVHVEKENTKVHPLFVQLYSGKHSS